MCVCMVCVCMHACMLVCVHMIVCMSPATTKQVLSFKKIEIEFHAYLESVDHMY